MSNDKLAATFHPRTTCPHTMCVRARGEWVCVECSAIVDDPDDEPGSVVLGED